MKSIAVVGFPKSGNTWLARLVAEVTDSNISIGTKDDPINSSDNSITRVGQYEIIKSHAPNKKHIVEIQNYIYIMRDVRDVVVSGFFFSNPFINSEEVKINALGRFTEIKRYYFRHQVRRMNLRWCGNEFDQLASCFVGTNFDVGSWSDHIRTWTVTPGVHIVRYEDLLSNTLFEISKIADFLAIDIDIMKLQAVIERQSFSRKKAFYNFKADKVNSRFLRSGQAGDWQHYLDEEMLKVITQRHGDCMRQWGYL